MRQAFGPGALGRPRGIGWRGRWEGGIGMGNTYKPMADSFQCMAKSTTIKKKEKKKNKLRKLLRSKYVITYKNTDISHVFDTSKPNKV